MAFLENPRLLYDGSNTSSPYVVDVLMPYYNTGAFVRAQVESILEQTVSCFRLTVLDNGSNAEDAVFIRDLLAGKANVRLFRVEKNVGVLNAFEFLLGTATAQYFALSDSDDIWDPDKLEISLNVLQQESRDLVYTDLRMADQNCTEFFPSKWRYSNTPPVQGHRPLPFVLKNPVSGCTIVGRSRLIPNAIPFPEGIPMHDRWLAIVAAMGGGVGYVNRATMLYRQHQSNDTGGLGFGLGALRERMRRNGGNASVYTARRIEARKVLLRYISAVAVCPADRRAARWMLWFYQRGFFGTLLATIPYMLLVVFVGRGVGLKNIAADAALNILRIYSRIRSPL